MHPRALLLAIGAALLSVASSAEAAYDFAAKPTLAGLAGCSAQQPGTSAPQIDASRTNMTRADISMAAYTRYVAGRKIVMYLGKDATSGTCFADAIGSTSSCRYDLSLSGTWQSLRGCGWGAPDTTSRPGFEVRNNTVYLEWQDLFVGGNRQTSRYSYPVSIALPTTVNLQTDIKIIEDSGIKNFNLTGLSYETDGGSRFMLLDFQMYSRWPNNLTLDDAGMVTLPGFTGAVTLDSYNLPNCTKTSGTGPYNTNDFCYQSGTVRINIGTQCDIGGTYAFNFDTQCMANAADNNCAGKVLSANALIGTADESGALKLDLCNSIFNTVAAVTGQMVADKPDGYLFGDTITLTATFNSPDLPIQESRLTNLILRRSTVARSPNLGVATTINRNLNTTLVSSPLGPAATGALSTLAVNTDFKYTPGANEVVFTVTPNMLPKDAGGDFATNSFITTDDFDSVSDFTFFATFRIYFDSVAAGGARRRRLLARDAVVPAAALRQTTTSDQSANVALTVPADPNPAPPVVLPPSTPGAPTTTQASTTSGLPMPAVIGITVAATLLFTSAIYLLAFALIRRKDRKRAEEEEAVQRLMATYRSLEGDGKAPVWGTAGHV